MMLPVTQCSRKQNKNRPHYFATLQFVFFILYAYAFIKSSQIMRPSSITLCYVMCKSSLYVRKEVMLHYIALH